MSVDQINRPFDFDRPDHLRKPFQPAELVYSHKLPDDDGFYINYILADVQVYEFFKNEFQNTENIVKQISKVKLIGYEVYMVQQWITKRMGKTIIVTYTGDSKDSIIGYRIKIINDPSRWPTSFYTYINELENSSYSSPTETLDHGIIFVTNLTQLESRLTLIPVPNGDVKKLYNNFVVSYNLKKLNCGTRSAMVINNPTKSVEDKFKSIFKIPSEISLNYSVIELVSIVQTFLFYYDLLEPRFVDGLFCEKTERAIENWWKLIDSISGSNDFVKTKNCAIDLSFLTIIGFTLSLKSTLELLGNNINPPKDPLDFDRFRQSIVNFQRIYKIKQSGVYGGKLDPETISKIIEISYTLKTNQTFTKDLSKVKKLVKNTMMDFTSGKTLHTLNISSPLNERNLVQDGSSNRFINCQELDSILKMCGGKRMNYLWKCKGKEPCLETSSLASSTKRKTSVALPTGANLNGDVGYREYDLPLSTLNTQTSDYTDSLSPQKDPLYRLSTQATDLTTCDSSSFYRQPGLSRHRSKTLIIGGSFQDNNHNSLNMSQTSINPFFEVDENDNERFKYEEDANAILFDSRLKRRHSIPSIHKELNINNIELKLSNYDENNNNNNIIHCDKSVKLKSMKLRRSNSFSILDENLGIVTNNIRNQDLITMEWLAIQYLNIQNDYKLNIVNYSNDFKKEISNSKMELLNKLNISRSIQNYDMLKNDNGKLMKRYHDLNDRFIKNFKINARLKYELRLLLQKTKEVESNLKTLQDLKIKSMENEIESLLIDIQKASDSKKETEFMKDLKCNTLLTKPHLIIYFLLYYLIQVWNYLTTHVGFDNKRIEDNWRRIDKNKSFKKFIDYCAEEGEKEIFLKNKESAINEITISSDEGSSIDGVESRQMD